MSYAICHIAYDIFPVIRTIFLAAGRRTEWDCQRADSCDRQFMQVVALRIGSRICSTIGVKVNHRSEDRRVISHPEPYPTASPRRNNLLDTRRRPWEVVGDRVDELACVRREVKAEGRLHIVVSDAEDRAERC